MIYIVIGLLCLGLILLLIARRQRQNQGLPTGRILAADMGRWQTNRQTLHDPHYNLAGRPDYLIRTAGGIVPVEVKSGRTPTEPHESHKFQLAAYCHLIGCTYGETPPFGILHYPEKTFQLDFTLQCQHELIALLHQIQAEQVRGELPDRSHQHSARCARCGFRQVCDQRLS